MGRGVFPKVETDGVVKGEYKICHLKMSLEQAFLGHKVTCQMVPKLKLLDAKPDCWNLSSLCQSRCSLSNET